MTEAEICRQLKKKKEVVKEAIDAVAKKLPSLKAKFIEGRLYYNTCLSVEECVEIYKQLGCNELQILFMKENYTGGHSADVYEIPGTHKFLDEYEKNPNIKCCNTCKYCLGKVAGTYPHPRPYCSVYEKFLSSFEAKVYEDWCSSYLKANLPKPRRWYKENAPINLNMYGETGTINGIDNSKMMNSERSVKGVVTRVNQVGFDD